MAASKKTSLSKLQGYPFSRSQNSSLKSYYCNGIIIQKQIKSFVLLICSQSQQDIPHLLLQRYV